jgi:glycosyltransferase involved in cell wall biosynthesis
LKVLVDPSVFRFGRCGLTRYYGTVCEGLRQRGVKLGIPLLSSSCDFQTSLSRYTGWIRRVPFGARVMDAASRRLFHRAVRRGNYDVILVTSPDFDAGFLAGKPDAPFLMVVHDLMTCVSAPDGLFDAAGPGMTRLLYMACRASTVLCISDDTRDALLSQEPIDPARVRVVPTGNLLASANVLAADVLLPERFLLFVGERSGRKGFYTLIQALKPVMQDFPDLQLICTGRLTDAEEDYLERRGMAGRVRSLLADDSTLVALYRNAFALLYPSLYEGFGLPVIEAMHYGCPVITTQNGALREVAGTAAIFVDPFNPQSIEAAVRSLLNGPEERQNRVALGFQQAAQFDVGTMLHAFQNALGQATLTDASNRT